MRIRTNYTMDTYLEKLGYNFQKERIELPVSLTEVLNCGFIQSNDCITLKALLEKGPELDTDYEKCQWEYNAHFHPDIHFKETENEIEFLKAGLECVVSLKQNLRKDFPDLSFRISMAFSETFREDGEIKFYGSSTVRFHQIRIACDNKMCIKYLNDYKRQAVLEMEI